MSEETDIQKTESVAPISSIELVRRLELCGEGAPAHTKNKAAHYLTRLTKLNAPQLPELERQVREALATNKWDNLREHMARWW